MKIAQTNQYNYQISHRSKLRPVSTNIVREGYAQYSPFLFQQNANSNKCIDALHLVSRYMSRMNSEIDEFKAAGDSILQPSQIPMTLLYQVAEKEIHRMEQYAKQKILYIITGRMGSGKTTFVNDYGLFDYCYSPDADAIKPLLPEYNEKGSNFVHKASCNINFANLSEALSRGINSVLQTATTLERIDSIINEAKRYGYKNIIMIHIDTNEENAIKRTQERAAKGGRVVDPEAIRLRRYIDEIVPLYQKPEKGLSQLIVYNNDGDSPVQVKNIYINK